MRLSKAFGSLFLLTSLTFVSPVFAGGGPVEFTIDPNTSLNPGEKYIIHARVYGDGPSATYCKNCLIHLKFKDPQGSDYIAQNSDRTDENGTIYAKVISKIPGNRIIYPTDLQTSDGKLIDSSNYIELAYTGQSPLPSTPLVNFYAEVTGQQYLGGPKRLVTINWNFLSDVVKVNVYARLSDSKDYGAALVGFSMMYPRSAQITINAYLDYYIKVDACASDDSCVSSEVYVPAMKKGAGSAPTPTTSPVTQNPKPTDSPVQNPNPTISPASNGDNRKVEELNKKVENLQNRLDQSKKTQSVLEQRINDLVNFIKHLFPFFK